MKTKQKNLERMMEEIVKMTTEEKFELFMKMYKSLMQEEGKVIDQVLEGCIRVHLTHRPSLSNDKEYLQIRPAELRKAVLKLRAVNHKLRQRIISLLEENKKMTVTDIYIKLRLEQSVASQHLAILRLSGTVVTERQGQHIYYSLDKDCLRKIGRIVEELADGVYHNLGDREDYGL